MKRLLIAVLVLVSFAAAGALAARAALDSDLVRTSIEQQLSARLGQPVAIAAANARLFPKVSVELRDVTIGRPASVQLREVSIAAGLRGLISKRVAEAEVHVTGAQVSLPLPFAFTGAPSSPEVSPSSGFVVSSIDRIVLSDVVVTAGRTSVTLDLESSVEGDRLAIARLTARAPATRIEASGEMTSLAKLEGSLQARAEPLDLDEMIAFGSAMASASPAASGPAAASPAAARPMRLAVELTAPNGSFDTYTFSALSAKIEIVPDRVTLSPLKVTSFGGSFEGKTEANTSGAVPVLVLRGQLRGFDVPALLRASGAAGGITGTLGGSVALNAAASDFAGLLRTANGSLDLAVTDGTIPGLEMVRSLVLAFGKPSGAPPEGSGSAFSRITGQFTLADRVMRTRALAFASRDFDLSGPGAFDLFTGQVDGLVDVRLSRELTAQAGTDLRRYTIEDGRIVVPVKISGTLERPQALPDIASAARRALENELQRRTRSIIEDLFKRKK